MLFSTADDASAGACDLSEAITSCVAGFCTPFSRAPALFASAVLLFLTDLSSEAEVLSALSLFRSASSLCDAVWPSDACPSLATFLAVPATLSDFSVLSESAVTCSASPDSLPLATWVFTSSPKPSASFREAKKPLPSLLSLVCAEEPLVSNSEVALLVTEFEEGLTFICTSSI